MNNIDKKCFEELKKFFRYNSSILVKIDEENLYMSANGRITFKFPIEYKEEILSIFKTQEKIEYKTFCIIKHVDVLLNGGIKTTFSFMDLDADKRIFRFISNLFKYVDLILATETALAGLMINFDYLRESIRLPDGKPNILGFTGIFDTEDGLLQVSLEDIEWTFEVLKQFSKPEEIKKFVDRKTKFLYMKNNIADVAICPSITIEEQRKLFKKSFLL